ncbi:MAG: hypothetical protein JWM50_110 [Microbacteriaceae bacterium]|nr:hypothetical protein [Microbacteriaceae bacterium]
MTDALGARRRTLAAAYARLVSPRATGLPNWLVVTWYPALVALLGLVLIALHISGTSSGVNFFTYETGVDPRLVWGSPKPIRGDEWLVQQGWVVSQAQQGFPLINGTFPGGMNSTAVMELPSWDWTALLRPHMWGFLLFGLEVGVAWQWWIPGIALASAAYLLFVTLVPRRPITAAFVATAVFFSPIIQWWYGPNSIWPVAWALLAISMTVWILRDTRRWVRVTWAVVVGWLAATAAIGLYIPFSLPCVLVFVFFFVGTVLRERPWSRERSAVLWKKLAPIVAAGIAAAALIGLFVVTRLDVFAAVGNTVYPGQRSDATGSIYVKDPQLAGLLGAPFGQSFSASSPNVLGANQSESATVILIALFLTPALAWFAVSKWRKNRHIDWVLVTTCLTVIIFLAYMLVPGWDAVARLLLLDRVQPERMRVGFLALTPVAIALVVREIDSMEVTGLKATLRRTLLPAAACAAVAAVLCGYIVFLVRTQDPYVQVVASYWKITTVAIVLCTFLFFFRRSITVAAALLLVAALTIGAGVNPLYRGLYNLNDTRIGQAVLEINRQDRGTWLGVGENPSMAVLMSSGVDAYSGMQPYPSEEMWHDIDPDKSDEDVWNRLAYVRWKFGVGEPVSTAPVADQIITTFDACSEFAQQHVDYVLADSDPPSMECLTSLDEEKQGGTDMAIYAVVPRAG